MSRTGTNLGILLALPLSFDYPPPVDVDLGEVDTQAEDDEEEDEERGEQHHPELERPFSKGGDTLEREYGGLMKRDLPPILLSMATSRSSEWRRKESRCSRDWRTRPTVEAGTTFSEKRLQVLSRNWEGVREVPRAMGDMRRPSKIFGGGRTFEEREVN